MADIPSKLPSFVSWPSFPFEGQLRTKRLDAPVAEEPPREGEDPSSCMACQASDESYIWVSDRWRVRAMDRPSGLPMVLILESRSHLDLGDLTNLLAAELGVMTVRLERAIRSIDGVERVHVNRWGDGAAHLHMWFLARPTGQLQLRGSFLSLWDDILEPIPESQWRESLAHVAAWLADFGGRSLAEPPRIEWHAPSYFGEVSDFSDDDAVDEVVDGAAGRGSVSVAADEAGVALDDSAPGLSNISSTGQADSPTSDSAPAQPYADGSVPDAQRVERSESQPGDDVNPEDSRLTGAAEDTSPHHESEDSASPLADNSTLGDTEDRDSTAPYSTPMDNGRSRNDSFDLDGADWGLTDDEIESSDILSR